MDVKKGDINAPYAEAGVHKKTAVLGKFFGRKRVREILYEIFIGMLYILWGYILGESTVFFGAKPFGIAFLCAADRKVAYLYAGLCVSALVTGGNGTVIYICVYTATVLIRVLSRLTVDNPWADKSKEGELPATLGEILPSVFRENIFLRMATSCVSAFMFGIYALAGGGFLFYDLYGMIISMVAAPVLVALYYGFFSEKEVSYNRKFIAFTALAASVVYAARNMTLAGVSASVFGVMLLTLYISRKMGTVYALIVGTVCGLAYSPMLAPMFAFAAIASGTLWNLSAVFSIAAACSVCSAWSLYVRGIGALNGILPAVIASSLIYAVADRLFFAGAKTKENIAVTEDVKTECCVLGQAELSRIILDDSEQKIKTICETFDSLSTLFYSLGERMREPAAADIKQICDSAFDACCAGCEMRSTCWETEYTGSLAAVGHICTLLKEKGQISESDVPSRMKERCARMPDIIDEINQNSMNHMQQILLGDKTEIFALDYESMSELLAQSMVAQKNDYEYCGELNRKICARMNELGVGVESTLVYGTRKRGFLIRGRDSAVLRTNGEKIREAVEEISGTPLTMSIEGADDGYTDVIMRTARQYRAEYAKRTLKADGEDGFCGDTVNIFENSSDCFYSFISDGMGSGRDAAFTSGICSVFLSKMLSASNRCDTSLRMLNGFLRNKGNGSMHECSATVDLMELDMITGKASFYKSGAAPTYVFREGSLFKLRSNTVPVGIIKELDAKKMSFDVGDGDVVVMVSDGVTQSREECPWLYDLLRANIGKEGLEHIADMIVERAKKEGATDDISVVVIKISRENPGKEP